MSASDLLVTIEVLDDSGNVVDERNATTYRKLLDAAHAAGLKGVATDVVANASGTIIVRATVTTSKGMFTGIGDASADNVPEKLKNALPRVAETRAICRALRAALNVGFVSVEEIGEPIRFANAERHADRLQNAEGARDRRDGSNAGNDNSSPRRDDERPPERQRGRDDRPTEGGQRDGGERRAMSANQRSLLFRLAYEEGHEGNAARDRVLGVLGVKRLEWATKLDASRAIEAMKREAAGKQNGQSNGAPHGPP